MTNNHDGPATPLTPVTFHVLLSLLHEPVHGYRIKRMIEERTDGAINVGAGTLYAGVRRMTRDGLIEETDPPDEGDLEPRANWRFYRITARGRRVLEDEIARMEADLDSARAVMRRPA